MLLATANIFSSLFFFTIVNLILGASFCVSLSTRSVSRPLFSLSCLNALLVLKLGTLRIMENMLYKKTAPKSISKIFILSSYKSNLISLVISVALMETISATAKFKAIKILLRFSGMSIINPLGSTYTPT